MAPLRPSTRQPSSRSFPTVSQRPREAAAARALQPSASQTSTETPAWSRRPSSSRHSSGSRRPRWSPGSAEHSTARLSSGMAKLRSSRARRSSRHLVRTRSDCGMEKVARAPPTRCSASMDRAPRESASRSVSRRGQRSAAPRQTSRGPSRQGLVSRPSPSRQAQSSARSSRLRSVAWRSRLSQRPTNSSCSCAASRAASNLSALNSQTTSSHWPDFTALQSSVSPTASSRRDASLRRSRLQSTRRRTASRRSSSTGCCTTLYQPSSSLWPSAARNICSLRGRGSIQRGCSTCSSAPGWSRRGRPGRSRPVSRTWSSGSRTRARPACRRSSRLAFESLASRRSARESPAATAWYATRLQRPRDASSRTSSPVIVADEPSLASSPSRRVLRGSCARARTARTHARVLRGSSCPMA
mmetsp:Transcript_16282/g.48955  ORF Transcript_16282/g.48955 Transcript_16282/m.48955 type:complete len:414 (+) Transcript_16282:389-1630(+)